MRTRRHSGNGNTNTGADNNGDHSRRVCERLLNRTVGHEQEHNRLLSSLKLLITAQDPTRVLFNGFRSDVRGVKKSSSAGHENVDSGRKGLDGRVLQIYRLRPLRGGTGKQALLSSSCATFGQLTRCR